MRKNVKYKSHYFTFKKRYLIILIEMLGGTFVMLKEIVGKRVRDLRITKTDMSQEEFSKVTNLDRTYLSRLESGKQNITIENLNVICNGLNISLKEFFEPFCYEIKDSEVETYEK